MKSKVLMIAYHYPPFQGSSGILRTVKFSTYLPENDWSPLVLTASPLSYAQKSAVTEIPSGTKVYRSLAFDTARHLAIRGRYPSFLAWPDRWVSWLPAATLRGLWLVLTHRPKVIWSTFPIATAHLVGYVLHRITGLPWIADFRDSMTEENYPEDPQVRRIYRWIERKTVFAATAVVFTTPGALAMYAKRYPDVLKDRWKIIENGFDEENFTDAQRHVVPKSTSIPARTHLKLLHSGLLYPKERDPRPFFVALRELKECSAINASTLQVVLRATGHDAIMRELIDRNDVADIVQLEGPIPYSAALAEMLEADGLIIFQAANCNHQIPAKLYEYLRAGRPILGLTDSLGDTANLMRTAGMNSIVALDDAGEIARRLPEFLVAIRNGSATRPIPSIVASYSRRARTAELAKLLRAASQNR
jgi:hypothetical protein